METSLFNGLPSEIRSEIWSHSFISPFAVKLQNDTLQHPLTRTCRQIRRETLAMFYSLTRFNAHLDDGPATPLLKWLRGLDPGNISHIKEVNVWDLHNLNGTLYGLEATQELLKKGPGDNNKKYVLRPAKDWVFAKYGGAKVLKQLVLVLQSVELGLLRFCVVDHQYHELDARDEYDEESEGNLVSPTSSFALVRLDSRPAGYIFTDQTTNIKWLAQDCGLSEHARADLIHALADDQSIIEIFDGTRRIVFDFTSLELGGRVVDEGCVENIGLALTIANERYDIYNHLSHTNILPERLHSSK